MLDNDSQNPELTAGSNISYWTDSVKPETLNPLSQNLQTDVVIIGGGLAGLTTAYCLAKSGRKIVLLEDGQIGSGETGRTTAQLTAALDDRYYNLEKTFGADDAKIIAQSHLAAIDFVENTVNSEGIDCEFERLDGYLFLHPTDKPDSLEKEYEATEKTGIKIARADVPGILKQREGIQFIDQAQFHPLKYLNGLRKVILENGGQIYTGTKAAKIDGHEVTTESGYKVGGNHIVVATNVPFNSKFIFPTKQFAYRTYVIGALVPKDSLPKAMWWDTGNYEMDSDLAPYHYVRIQRYNDRYDLLISGGEDHATGDTSDIDVPEEGRYELLENWTRQFFPIGDIVYKWSGQVMEPIDGVAYIGKSPFDDDNVYIITGDSGNGMTHCTIGGMLVSDLINGKKNPWEKMYRPSRFTFSESGLAFQKLFGEAMSYFKQKPGTKTAEAISSIQNGDARIVELNDDKVGAYRSDDGILHVVSSRCTHLGCFVAWNDDEKTWDCPCHGSRFGYDGKVINGPANTDLSYYQDKM